MSVLSGRPAQIDVDRHEPGASSRRAWAWPGRARIAEALGVLLSPAIAVLVLRIRLMQPFDLPDPAMHTTFIVDPRDPFTRFTFAYSQIAGMREGARVGFLVPARLSYLAFGAVPGFFVLRYVLALLAVIPVYLLLRRLYGPPAGVAGIIVVLSSPVLITAWGADYPDSAVVSYAAAAMACLAMPCLPRFRRAWLAAAGVLLTAALWSHGVAVPLVAATLAGYVGVRLVRDRSGLTADLALLAGIGVAVTGFFVVASAVLLGHPNFIATTWQAFLYLTTPKMVAFAHSASWRWAPYLAYLLVPPALLGALAVAAARRLRMLIPTPVLLVGVMAAVQLGVYACLQFFGTVETLEEHYFSSTLWAGVCLVLAITVAELAWPLADRPLARWLPAAVLLAVPLGYEAGPRVPAFGWAPVGLLVAVGVIATAAVARGSASFARPLARAAATGLALAAMAAAALVLTVASSPSHPVLANTAAHDDPLPSYASALGGNASRDINAYRLATEIPVFVGPASYYGEQLLIWWPIVHKHFPDNEFAGMYNGMYNTIQTDLVFTKGVGKVLRLRRPGEILLFDGSAAPFPAVLRSLAPFRATLLRAATLRSGGIVLHVWLIRLGRYFGHPAGAA